MRVAARLGWSPKPAQAEPRITTVDSRALDLVLRRATAGFGLARASLSEVVEAMTGPTPGDRSILREVGLVADSRAALGFLAEVTHPATRHVLFQAGDWVAIMNNGRDGSDFADTQGWLAPRVATTTLRVVDQPAIVVERNGYRCRVHYEARIIEVREGASLLRSIDCVDDGGRWTFEVAGEPLPVESTFDYGARRRRDRFTSENLAAVLASLGAGRVDESTITSATEFVMLAEELTDAAWRQRIEVAACSVTEAEDPAHGYFLRAQTWIDHLETHASSAVVDLTKAVILNSTYEEQARNVLKSAKRILGSAEFDRLVAQAHADLGSSA